MSVNAWADLGRAVSAASVRLAWSQWRGLGAPAVGGAGPRPSSTVDMEALILVSLAFREEERRLGDMVAWWAEVAAPLTSLQRMRAVAKRFPDPAGEAGLRAFASMAAHHGDRRWLRVADPKLAEGVRSGKGRSRPALLEPCALWSRLRAGLGVGAKADALAFLLGLGGGWASARTIAFATGYSTVTIGKAASEMVMAGLLRATDGRPIEYMAPPGPWGDLLAPEGSGAMEPRREALPPWRHWAEISALLAGAAALSREALEDGAGREHVIASRARDLIERHRRALDLDRIPVSVAERHRGLAAVEALAEAVKTVAAWTETAL